MEHSSEIADQCLLGRKGNIESLNNGRRKALLQLTFVNLCHHLPCRFHNCNFLRHVRPCPMNRKQYKLRYSVHKLIDSYESIQFHS
jgi:hypothetical protein